MMIRLSLMTGTKGHLKPRKQNKSQNARCFDRKFVKKGSIAEVFNDTNNKPLKHLRQPLSARI